MAATQTAPADDEETGAAGDGADSGQDEAQDQADGGDEGDADEGGGTVIATLIANADGSYTVVHGDEDEGEEGEGGGEEAAEGAEEGAEGEAAGGEEAEGGEGEGEEGEEEAEEGAEGGEEAEPEQQHCDTIGEALKAILDIAREHESGGEDQFGAGYEGEGTEGEGAPPKTVKY